MARVRLRLVLPIVIVLLGACVPQPQVPRADRGAEPVTFNNRIVYLFTRVLGLPSIWVPYAPHEEANHSPNESITLEGFINGIRSTAAALFEIAAA